MKTKNTIITILVLVLAWFLIQHFTKNIEPTHMQQQDTQTPEISETESVTEEIPESNNDSEEAIVTELEVISAEEEVLDAELDELENLPF